MHSVIYRYEVRPLYGEAGLSGLKNYAKQAELSPSRIHGFSNELRQSLQQQTATADVLKVISRSTFDLQTVLDTLAELAVRLCEADIASITASEGSNYRVRRNFRRAGRCARTRLKRSIRAWARQLHRPHRARTPAGSSRRRSGRSGLH